MISMDTHAIQQFANEYGPYLEDARRRIIFLATTFLVLFIAGFMASPFLIKRLIILMHFKTVEYVVLSPFQLLSTSMNLGFFLAIFFSIPLILLQIHGFFSSAFTRRERKVFIQYLTSAIILFFAGFLYGAAVLYYAADVVALYNTALGLTNVWDVDLFLSQTLLTSALLGLLFEYPLILLLLVRFNVFRHRHLVKSRLYAYCIVAIIVGLLPPSDVVSLTVIALPLVGLYELTRIIARGNKRQAVQTFTSLRPL